MSDTSDPADAQVPNQYKAALNAAIPGATSRGDSVRSALNAATAAMMAGAWESTTARAFGKELAGHRTTLQTTSRHEVDAIEAEAKSQPATVAKNSWQANFARVSRTLQ